MSWSPQRYISEGRAKGHDAKLLETASAEISRAIFGNPSVPAVLTLGHLASRCGVDYRTLRRVVVRDGTHYNYFRIRKRSGGHRLISVPAIELLWVQKWIHTHILKRAKPHNSCFSFIPKTSIRDCASRHVGARWVIKLDISAFFGSISERDVFDVFVRLGYRPLIAFEMSRIVTDAPSHSKRYSEKPWKRFPGAYAIPDYKSDRVGFLPQGAPTSPLLSNLVMLHLDEKLAELAQSHGLRYSRYSDDITFSTYGDFSRKSSTLLVKTVERMLLAKGLIINSKKTRIIPPGGRKTVLGLVVDGPEPKLSRKFRDTMRMHLYYIRRFGPQAHAHKRGFSSVSGLYRHLKGLIDYSKSIDNDYWLKTSTEFRQLDWPSGWVY